ncbi:MAG: DUF475 domain-containing protein, partial [Phycisphaerae bacterium]|nr:DUF475 domain-containing protein [Saprospiraceae bacterium]
MKTFFRFYGWSSAFALVALAVSFWLGYQSGGTLGAGVSLLFTALMLGILETSLSFDNAVVNAKILETMPPFWRKMFLTIGILIAVFGMRIVFPIVIVWLVSSLPFDAVLAMTWQDPHAFQKIIIDQNVVISGFGGAFLWMVFFRFFFDPHKDIHWVPGLERNMSRLGRLEGVWVV